MRARRVSALALPLAAALLSLLLPLYQSVWAQDPAGPMLFRSHYEPGVIALDVHTSESGTVMGTVPQAIESTVAVLSRTRALEGDNARQDTYVMDFDLLVTVNGETQVDTANGRDIDLGTGDPRGSCTTTLTDPRGRVLETVGGAHDSEPVGRLTELAMSKLIELPEQPVAVGGEWETGGELALEDQGGSVSYRANWRFDRIDEEDGVRTPVLIATATVTGQDLAAPEKGVTVDIPGQGPTALRVREHVQEITVEYVITMRWNLEKSRADRVVYETNTHAVSTQTVLGADGAQIAQQGGIEVQREGTTVTNEREATDEELARIPALALASSIQRGSPELLRTIATGEAQLLEIEDDIASIGAEYREVSAKATDLRFEPAGDAGVVRFRLAVSGRKPEIRPGADLSDPETIIDAEFALDLVHADGEWRLAAVRQ